MYACAHLSHQLLAPSAAKNWLPSNHLAAAAAAAAAHLFMPSKALSGSNLPHWQQQQQQQQQQGVVLCKQRRMITSASTGWSKLAVAAVQLNSSCMHMPKPTSRCCADDASSTSLWSAASP
jgi:hypothetical protein